MKKQNKDKEVELQESTKQSSDETNTTTTELTNITATTVVMAKQVDSNQTPVDDVDDSGSTKVSLDQNPDTSSKKRTNEATDSSSSRKSKEHVRPEESNAYPGAIFRHYSTF